MQNNRLETLSQSHERIQQSMEQIIRGQQYIKTQNGNLALQSGVMSLTLKELQALYPELYAKFKILDVNTKRVSAGSTTIIEGRKNIYTRLRDSLIYDTVDVKVFNYKDPWYNVSGQTIKDSIKVNIAYSDTLIQVVYKGRRTKPWLWIFSPRELEQRIMLSSPSSTIKYSKTIQISKP
jgi:hypothetical protein